MKRVLMAAAALCCLGTIAGAQQAPAVPDKFDVELTKEEAAVAVDLFDKACIASGSVRGAICQNAQILIGKIGQAAQPKPPAATPDNAAANGKPQPPAQKLNK